MKKLILFLIPFALVSCGEQKETAGPTVNLILDTDMGPDYDDVGLWL